MPRFGWLLAAAVAVALVAPAGAGCAAGRALRAEDCTCPFAPPAARAADGSGLSLLTAAERALPVAEIGGRIITLADFQKSIDDQAADLRARYADPAAREALLEQLVRFELLAMAAYRRGYATDPAVSRATKEALVRELLDGDLDPEADARGIPAAELAWYYEEHKAELRRPAEVRASVIVLGDRAAAEAVRAEADGADDAAWRALVERSSIDPATRERGGDLGWFARPSDGGAVDAAVAEAAFALGEPGAVAPVVVAASGPCVVRLVERRPEVEPAFDEVRDAIALRLARERRARALEAYLIVLEAKVDVRLHPENLAHAKVVLKAARPGLSSVDARVGP
jgi:hypothetical protein